MVTGDIEKAVFDLVETYNGPGLFRGKRPVLKRETDLNNDFKMLPEDAYDLLVNYAEEFDINPKDINFLSYFPEDLSAPHSPITIDLLIRSAEAGRWLDAHP
ncbi:DUF1493 family protein [Erwinia phyllosphaerae]|uniref:DUF1493 family protein n=1 Tax=Erwinia phyllosphaerae TaxID=2853256 RepID=UPI001FF0171E|nr:DUF1493 family protein [Erwinia phyllosphaerae]MBV4366361.1 DUF1493 family protein [Erwinia phyllosphaerae]